MRFLIVDDSYDWIKYHYANIQNTMPKAEIDTAISGFEGLNKVLAKDADYYDVILSDMQMEDVDSEDYAGIWLIKRLSESGKCKNTKIVIVSAVYNIQEVAKKLNTDYLSKASLVSSATAFEYKLKELLKF